MIHQWRNQPRIYMLTTKSYGIQIGTQHKNREGETEKVSSVGIFVECVIVSEASHLLTITPKSSPVHTGGNRIRPDRNGDSQKGGWIPAVATISWYKVSYNLVKLCRWLEQNRKKAIPTRITWDTMDCKDEVWVLELDCLSCHVMGPQISFLWNVVNPSYLTRLPWRTNKWMHVICLKQFQAYHKHSASLSHCN